VRDELALIRCGNRIYEVTTATLGPLPLDQLPKSKPVTPYAVFLIVPIWPTFAKLNSVRATSCDNTARRSRIPGGQVTLT
jgi:hypothetical protein